MADATVVKGMSGLDVDAAVKNLVEHAADSSSGRCALFVRQALIAGKVIIHPHPINAREYGPYLTAKGFVAVDAKDYKEVKGDIAVIQPYVGGASAGHIAMFDGSSWVSDFVQRDMWSGPGYRLNKPAYVIYRP